MMSRREALALMGAAPLASTIEWTPARADRALRTARTARAAAAGGQTYEPAFFSTHEYATVRVLVDIVIPRDERSGSATDAGVPEFMDVFLADQSERAQTGMRGGLAWLDAECRERFDTAFVDCSDGERTAVLDDIAWPARARPELSHGVAFFNSFRDLTASGFFSSRMGVEDLQYMGNTSVAEWTGCPEEQLRRLGVRYED